MDEKPAETGERLPGEPVILGGATVLLSVLPFGLLVAPSPLAVLVLRHGLASGIVAAVLSGVAASLVTRSELILAQVLLSLALGIALGEALRESLGVRRTLVLSALVVFLTTWLLMYVFEQLTGMRLIDVVTAFWREALKSVAGSDAAAYEALLEAQIAAMRATLPASLLLGSAALAVLDFALTRWLVRKLPGGEEAVPALCPFSRWAFPRWVGGAYVAGRLLELAIGTRMGSGILVGLLNVTLVLEFLLMIQGFAVGWHYLGRVRLAKALRLLLAGGFYLFAQPVSTFLFLLTGLLDTWLDLRRLQKSQSPDIEGGLT